MAFASLPAPPVVADVDRFAMSAKSTSFCLMLDFLDMVLFFIVLYQVCTTLAGNIGTIWSLM